MKTNGQSIVYVLPREQNSPRESRFILQDSLSNLSNVPANIHRTKALAASALAAYSGYAST